MEIANDSGCGQATHFNRRTLLKFAGASGLAWLTPVAELLAWQHERDPAGRPAKSLILLWLAGGPSQLETFDPHPGTSIAAGTDAIATAAPGVQLARGLEQTAEVMDHLMLIRSMVSKEGDHERATYHVKTGYRPEPTLVHPALGAVLCHQTPVAGIEIPRHVSILPGGSAARGGYLGDAYDAFQIGDPRDPLPDMRPPVPKPRFQQRLDDLAVIDRQFAKGREARLEPRGTSHTTRLDQAVRMMDSEQLKAFDLQDVPQDVLRPFGDSAFGRGCLVAARLIEVGVRCVEVTLGGWDSHVANHELHDQRKRDLDPALAALIRYLVQHDRLSDTIVLCGGEFGRTPQVNPAGGRDHWPHGFSLALAGGGLPGGHVIGETDPEGGRLAYEQGVTVADLHASLLSRLGIDPRHEILTPVGRPVKLSDGRVVF